jgi:exonuclease SbcC
MSKLARLRLHNFKGKRSEWAIAPKMLLVGPNGAGKSAVLQAVMVGILGYEPRLGRTPASVVQLASGREMSVEIETDAKFIFHRTFKLTRGAVSTSVWVSPHQGEKNLADAHKRIAEEVGDFAVSFDLNAFLSLSDAKKRAFLFGLSPTKGLGWDKAHLKSQLIQAVRAPVSSLTLHAWIDKAFALWSEGHDLQFNFDRMLIYLKKEFSLWSLRKKEGISAARRMLQTRNQEPFVPSEATRTTQREIEEIQERIIRIREELAKDEARRQSAEARGREMEAIRARLAEWQAAAMSVEQIESRLSELKGRSFDRVPMRAERSQIEQATAALFAEIEREEKRLNDLRITLEIEKKGLDRAESVQGICPVVEGIQCPVDFAPVISQGRDRLSAQETAIGEIEALQTMRWQRYRGLQESLGHFQARALLLDEEERETRKQIAAWEEMLQRAGQGEEKQTELTETLSRLEAEEAADGGYADPSDLILQKEGLERHLEELKRRLADQEERRSLWIAYQQNQVDVKKADANVEALKQLIVALGPKGLQGEMIKERIGPLSKIVNDLLHAIDPEKELVFRFQDGRGNEIFEMGWKRGEQFIPFEALSTGERVLFSAALMTALILFREPRCRLLLVDHLESVDLHHRRRFIEALCTFVDEGHLDHFIAAGVEGIPPGDAARWGVKMIQMADSEKASA